MAIMVICVLDAEEVEGRLLKMCVPMRGVISSVPAQELETPNLVPWRCVYFYVSQFMAENAA
jgi:hypothetical protein